MLLKHIIIIILNDNDAVCGHITGSEMSSFREIYHHWSHRKFFFRYSQWRKFHHNGDIPVSGLYSCFISRWAILLSEESLIWHQYRHNLFSFYYGCKVRLIIHPLYPDDVITWKRFTGPLWAPMDYSRKGPIMRTFGVIYVEGEVEQSSCQ